MSVCFVASWPLPLAGMFYKSASLSSGNLQFVDHVAALWFRGGSFQTLSVFGKVALGQPWVRLEHRSIVSCMSRNQKSN